jgi:folate-binding protein YgfZ
MEEVAGVVGSCGSQPQVWHTETSEGSAAGSYPGAVAVSPAVATADPHAYEVLVEGCGLLDRSERGKLALTGPEGKAFLQGQLSNDIEALVPGTGCYAALLTPKGKMLGDLRVLDTGRELLLDTERVALQALFNRIRQHKLGFDVELHKRTLELGELSLIGPRARDVAEVAGLGADEHASAWGEVAGVEALWVATDVGVDAFVPAEQARAVGEALAARGAEPVPEPPAEALRVERGRPRYGIDLDDTVIPQEAGLNERAVSFTKGCYVGQETVARLHYRGRPTRHLRGLALSAPAPTGAELRLGDRVVGAVGSSVVHPLRGPIALALVRREAGPGDELAVGDGAVTARVVELPFS